MRTLQLLALALLATVARADNIPGYVTTNLANIDDGTKFSFVDINDNGLVLGYTCNGDCEGALWGPGGGGEPIYMLWGIGGTQVLDLNDDDEVLAEANPDIGFLPAPQYVIFNPLTAGRESGPCDEVGVICSFNDSLWEPVVVIEKDGQVLADWNLSQWDPIQAVNKRG